MLLKAGGSSRENVSGNPDRISGFPETYALAERRLFNTVGAGDAFVRT